MQSRSCDAFQELIYPMKLVRHITLTQSGSQHKNNSETVGAAPVSRAIQISDRISDDTYTGSLSASTASEAVKDSLVSGLIQFINCSQV